MKARNGGTILRLLAPALGLLIFLVAWAPFAHASKEDWREKWEKTVEAAKKEEQLVIYHSNVYDRLFEEFEKKYPEIKLTKVMLRGAGLAAGHGRKAGKKTSRGFVSWGSLDNVKRLS